MTAIQRLLQARACLCDALSPDTTLCLCAVVHGDPPLEMVQGGLGIAWVRLVRTYPSNTLPTQDSTLSNCGAPLALRIEMGVARCSITPLRGSMTATEYEAMATQAMADHDAMQRAACCITGDLIVGEYLPNSAGGIYGGTLVIDLAEE